MKVSKVIFGELKLGGQVLSHLGTFGKIVDKWIDPKGIGHLDPDNYWVRINWNSGNVSYQQHNDLDKVTYLS